MHSLTSDDLRSALVHRHEFWRSEVVSRSRGTMQQLSWVHHASYSIWSARSRQAAINIDEPEAPKGRLVMGPPFIWTPTAFAT
jgi:hypothetical protein